MEIEDDIMHPLVSGEHAKRYVKPKTDTYILFPYEEYEGNMRLIPEQKMQQNYPRAWQYLKSYEGEHRSDVLHTMAAHHKPALLRYDRSSGLH